MTARNEAAQRILDRHGHRMVGNPVRLASDYLYEALADALARERRATVERIRERLTIHNEWGSTNVLWPSEVNAILDEEAAR